MALDALLAIGLLFTSATQMRFSGLPIGPGEICLVVWIGLTGVRLVLEPRPLLTRGLKLVVTFWAIFACTLSIGTLVGLATGERYDPNLFMHDVFAYALLLAMSTFSVAGPDAGLRLQRTGWVLAISGSLVLAFQVAVGFGLPSQLFEPWFWERFRGWSDNPNQLAFTCVVLMLLAAHLAETASRASARIVALGCLALPFIVGRLTQSDTFLLAAVAAPLLFLGMKIRSWAAQPQTSGVRGPFALLIALMLPLLLASGVPLMTRDEAGGAHDALALTKGGGKEVTQEADLRFMLWREAIQRGVSTAGLGLGPGPHLKIPGQILLDHDDSENGPTDTKHPQEIGAMNFEAHNTVLDLLTQSGVIGVLCFLWLQIAAFMRAWKARLAGLVTLLGGAFLFGLTNLIVREPLFWYAAALCLAAESSLVVASAPERRTIAGERGQEAPG